ncbi:MAG: hypothetical protein KGI54_15560 [Pseudomonadota bacterium]|nr:hypothetical protein [Pseudomonadota bacterium]
MKSSNQSEILNIYQNGPDAEEHTDIPLNACRKTRNRKSKLQPYASLIQHYRSLDWSYQQITNNLNHKYKDEVHCTRTTVWRFHKSLEEL